MGSGSYTHPYNGYSSGTTYQEADGAHAVRVRYRSPAGRLVELIVYRPDEEKARKSAKAVAETFKAILTPVAPGGLPRTLDAIKGRPRDEAAVAAVEKAAEDWFAKITTCRKTRVVDGAEETFEPTGKAD